jgi:hypothetical protein
VEAAEEEATEAKQEARAADAENKAAREVQALRAATAATRAMSAREVVPEDERGCGLVVCCAAIDDDDFVDDFLYRKEVELCGDAAKGTVGTIGCVSSTLAARDAHVASVAIVMSRHARTTFWRHTYRGRRGDLRGCSMRPSVSHTLKRSTTMCSALRESSKDKETSRSSATASGREPGTGGGFRPTEERFVFLKCLNNILPQMGGRGKDQTPSLAAA